MFISKELESTLLDDLVSKVKALDLKLDNNKVVVLCVSPDYSSIVSLRVLHALSKDGELPQFGFLDVAYPNDPEEKKESYKQILRMIAPHFKKELEKIILVEAAVLTGNNYTWIKEELVKVGFKSEDIISIALVESKDSIFKSDLVAQYTEDMPEFYWEEYNKHWE